MFWVMTSFPHFFVTSSGIRIHCVGSTPEAAADQGRPLVVLIHGFPESWYSWRHQLTALTDAGFCPVAIDVRGYGRSDAPPSIGSYAMSALVGDVIAVLDHAGRDQAVVVGHDWGAPVAWNTALMRPDRVSGVAGLSVPYSPRGDTKPLDAFRALAADELFYIDYFQQPNVVEAEVEEDLAGWLRGFYFTASGEADHGKPPMIFVTPGHQLRERLQQPQPGQMSWMSDEDFDFYLNEFQRTGLTGGFNRYRNITRDWYELAPWRLAPITVPAMFIGGDRDGPTLLGQNAIDRFPTSLPHLVHSEILTDCGHWVQQEQADVVNRLLVDFVTGLVQPT